jgi:hypothetical protein
VILILTRYVQREQQHNSNSDVILLQHHSEIVN